MFERYSVLEMGSNGMDLIIDAFWFFLPAGIANMVPVVVSKMPVLKHWKTPIDFGRSHKNQRIFGDNKTWRGLCFGTMAAGFVGLVQYKLIIPSETASLIIFSNSALMGLGALVGDAVESFFKRRRNLSPGQTWFPFDQTDYIIGGLLFAAPFSRLSWQLVLTVLFLYLGLHVTIVYTCYLLGIRDRPI